MMHGRMHEKRPRKVPSREKSMKKFYDSHAHNLRSLVPVDPKHMAIPVALSIPQKIGKPLSLFLPLDENFETLNLYVEVRINLRCPDPRIRRFVIRVPFKES